MGKHLINQLKTEDNIKRFAAEDRRILL